MFYFDNYGVGVRKDFGMFGVGVIRLENLNFFLRDIFWVLELELEEKWLVFVWFRMVVCLLLFFFDVMVLNILFMYWNMYFD